MAHNDNHRGANFANQGRETYAYTIALRKAHIPTLKYLFNAIALLVFVTNGLLLNTESRHGNCESEHRHSRRTCPQA